MIYLHSIAFGVLIALCYIRMHTTNTAFLKSFIYVHSVPLHRCNGHTPFLSRTFWCIINSFTSIKRHSYSLPFILRARPLPECVHMHMKCMRMQTECEQMLHDGSCVRAPRAQGYCTTEWWPAHIFIGWWGPLHHCWNSPLHLPPLRHPPPYRHAAECGLPRLCYAGGVRHVRRRSPSRGASQGRSGQSSSCRPHTWRLWCTALWLQSRERSLTSCESPCMCRRARLG